MRRHAPFGLTDPNFYVWGGVTDVINCAKFFGKSVQGFPCWKTLKNDISHWKRSSPLQQCCATAHRLWYFGRTHTRIVR